MNKHTPGPWHQCASSVYGPIADRSGHSDLIAACHTGLRDSEGRQFANAALIAAAPDLLDACYAALDYACMLNENQELIDAIDAAICKAQGGAQ